MNCYKLNLLQVANGTMDSSVADLVASSTARAKGTRKRPKSSTTWCTWTNCNWYIVQLRSERIELHNSNLLNDNAYEC